MENEAPARRRVDRRDRQGNWDRLMQTLLDAGRGLVIFLAGVFFLFAPRFNFNFGIDDTYRYSFSGLCLLYGGWRIYRGYKKNYY